MTGRARILALVGATAIGCYYTVEELAPAGDGGTQTKPCAPACQTDELCVDGACIKNCGALTDCDGVCVDTNTAAHCGECDNACSPSQVCELGACKDDCTTGLTRCAQDCVDTRTSTTHCGGCDAACLADQDCVAGDCVPSCESQLTAPFVDPWGNTWDGANRAASSYDAARLDCDGIRARLPLVTQAYRVRSGTLAPLPGITNTEAWTSAWVNTTTQYAIDFSDGTTSDVPVIETREYRCVCPAPDTPGFSAGDCLGLLGNECFTVPFQNLNVDNQDRPRLEKQAALRECNALGGRLPTLGELGGAVDLLLPNGTNEALFVANDMSTSDSAAIQFQDPDWSASSGGFTRWDYVDDTWFRCAGWKLQPTPNPITIAGAFVSERSGRKLDGADRAPLPFDEAVQACWLAGGHLAMSTELAEMIIEGAGNGSTASVQTADHSTPSNTLGLAWSQEAVRWSYPGNIASEAKTTARVFRCIYYPLSATATPPTACEGGCAAITSHGATQWIDQQPRAGTSSGQAVKTCVNLGASVASVRDLLEAFGNGLPLPSTPLPVHVLEASITTLDGGSGNGMLTFHEGLAPNDPNSPAGFEAISLNDTRAYRCHWTNELR
jgi:hypothetical protein